MFFSPFCWLSRNYRNACSQSNTMNISKPHEWVRIVCCLASCLSILWNLAPFSTLPLKVFDETPVKSQCFVTSLAIHDALWFVLISTLINGMWFIKLFFILYKHLIVVVCCISDTGIYFIYLRTFFYLEIVECLPELVNSAHSKIQMVCALFTNSI